MKWLRVRRVMRCTLRVVEVESNVVSLVCGVGLHVDELASFLTG